jgi:hypothetical protein
MGNTRSPWRYDVGHAAAAETATMHDSALCLSFSLTIITDRCAAKIKDELPRKF